MKNYNLNTVKEPLLWSAIEAKVQAVFKKIDDFRSEISGLNSKLAEERVIVAERCCKKIAELRTVLISAEKAAREELGLTFDEKHEKERLEDELKKFY